MKQVSLTVNGEAVTAAVEPRTHLADFLRSDLGLTGTHLGCEQGVCGACTVMIDGKPMRSCITYAVACDGSEVRTIEGFDGDPLMGRLREAFSTHHGLQCGFCTPGMLITSRDIAGRLDGPDEARIRLELSGNLCRCTGYVGIVEAVKSVLAEGRTVPADIAVKPRRAAGPATFERRSDGAPSKPSPAPQQAELATRATDRKNWTVLAESFDVPHSPDDVWALMQDVPDVAGCMPGAEVVEFDGRRLRGRVRVKFGPISAAFEGEGTVDSDAAAKQGTISGEGADRRSNSRAKGLVTYRLVPEQGGRATRVEVQVEFQLTGMLAQFSRSGLVKDFAHRLTADFARNLSLRLSGEGGSALPAGETKEVNAIALIFSVLWRRLKSLLKG
ncbi:xanthine dehydrogenase family Fe-S subunit [Rhodospirillaceae bacterium SYSU D60014]|uniref:xanthine dehydrogenase family Fe-S subunit n=1 Tax=Virgifigura deserti TaxID=2268457 RepID=UPI000E662C89